MYQYCQWCPERNGIPFRTPPTHPFNSLKVLRLAIALGLTYTTIATIFRYVWGDGKNIETETDFIELLAYLNVDPEHV